MNAAIPERRHATEEISGVVERVIFHSDESGFCVLHVKARGQRDENNRRRVAAFDDRWGMAERGGLVGGFAALRNRATLLRLPGVRI
jgi:hypothetical protein